MKKALEYFIAFIFGITLSFVVFTNNIEQNILNRKNNINIEQKKSVIFASKNNINGVSEQTIKNLPENKEEKNNKENLVFFNNTLEIIKAGYVEEVNEKKLYENALNGILSSLDPHSSFLNEKEFKDIQMQTKGEFGGLGIVVTKEDSFIKVISPIEDTPAFRANILSGDFIAQINEENTHNMSLFDAVERMRGKVGEKVKLVILRKGLDKPIVLELKREIIKTEVIKGSLKSDNILYLRITNFTQNTKNDLLKNFIKLTDELKTKNQELIGVILDLRSNPGGLLDQAVKVSELFLENGNSIVSIKGRNGVLLEEFTSSLKNPIIPKEIPIVVLINEGSASASEIVAGALQDHKRAILLGKKTFGKASVQQVFPFTNGTAVKMTIARYYTPNGRSLQAEGIEPDIFVNNAEIKFFENEFTIREKDLRGHLVGEKEDALDKTLKEEKIKENKKVDDELLRDYQLSRAVDLIKGVNHFDFKNKKSNTVIKNKKNVNK